VPRPSIPSILFLTAFFSFLFYTAYVAYIQVDGKMLLTGENDFFLEFGYIASFFKGVNSNRGFLTGLLLPLCSGNPGRSEYLPTIYAALLQTAGASAQFAVFVQTILLMFSIVLLQYSLTYRISKSEYYACLSVPVIFLPGGFGFLRFLMNRVRYDSNVDYIFYLGGSEFNMWGHPLLHCILTSRVILLTMALSILSFASLEADHLHLPATLGLVIVFIRPQTAVAFFICFFLYKTPLNLRRWLYAIPALMLFKYMHVPFVKASPLWAYATYHNTLCPPLTFLFRIFGLLIPSLLFIAARPVLVLRLLAPAFAIGVLSVFQLQRELRFNFFALLATGVPLLCAVAFAALSAFRDLWKSAEQRGVINCLVAFAAVGMCLSSLAGIRGRLAQKFTAWDADALAIGHWIADNTPPTAVFATQLPAKWNPAVAIAGRCAFDSIDPTLQSAEYRNLGRLEMLNAFLVQNAPLADVNYFVVEKKTKFHQVMATKIGKVVTLVYENDRYQLLESLT
jgi:hypothetical protein